MSELKRDSPVYIANWTNNPPYLGNGATQEASYYYLHIEGRLRAFYCYRNWRL